VTAAAGPATLASVRAAVDELAPLVGVDPPPVVASRDPHVSMSVVSGADGVVLTVTEGYPFLEEIDLRSAVVHELFHVLQLRQGFPLVYALDDPLNLAAQVQNAVADLHVTGLMVSGGFGGEAESVTLHRLDGLAALDRVVARYGLLPVVTRLPLVAEEVARHFPQHASRLAEVSAAADRACPSGHRRAWREIRSVLAGLGTAATGWSPAVVLDAYRRVFVALSPNGRFSVVEPGVFLITKAGEHLR